MLHGEIWKAVCLDEEIQEGENVKVIERKDLTLKVRKIKSVKRLVGSRIFLKDELRHKF